MTERSAVEVALARAEEAVAQGASLKGTGFWKAVGQVKRDRDLVARYADRIAMIDRRAFERGVKLRVPLTVGLSGLLLVTMLGIAAIIISRGGIPSGLAALFFLGGLAALIVGSHSLAHVVVGRIAGIRFTHAFLGGPPPPRPGVKTDYATYLRASPMSRAVMHASGAVLTKLIPFALIPFIPDIRQRTWIFWALIAIGIVQILTDVFLSTKVSDWKKVRRELGSVSRNLRDA